jgi:hypothetical protein
VTTPAQPPVKSAAPRPLRAWTDFDRLTQRREDDPKIIVSAILLTILLHGMLFFWILPWVGSAMQISRYATNTPTSATPPPVEYVLTPLTPADQQALRYMETNPNAPVAKPDATSNISDRDQRVAQPIPNPNGHSDKPQTDGQQLNTQKIVQGDLSRPAPAPAPPMPVTPPAQKPAAAKEPTAPAVAAAAPPALPAKAASSDGEGIRIEEKPLQNFADKPSESPLPPTVANMQPNPRLRPGPLTPDVVAESAAEATPQTRPSLDMKTHAGPIVMERQGTHDVAPYMAVDAKFTQFGAYLGMMYEAISSQWDDECVNYSFDLHDAGTEVETDFVINSKGEITELKVANSTAGRGPTLMCTNAIKLPAPYGPWSKEMIALLGQEQTVHITFFYQ